LAAVSYCVILQIVEHCTDCSSSVWWTHSTVWTHDNRPMLLVGS